MAKQVTLNIKSLDTAIAELESIVAKVKAETGTAAERLKKAKAEAIASGAVKTPTLAIKASDDIATAEALVAEWQSSLAQRIDEATTAVLKAKKDDSETGLVALRETFAAKAEAATAIKTMLVSIKVPGAADRVIPTLKGTRSASTGGTAKVSNVQWYIIRANGTRKDMTPAQNKVSSVAWYHGAEIGVPDCTGNKGKGCSKDEMVSFLEKAGAKIKDGEAWSFKVKATGVTVGMDVTAKAGEA